LFLSAGELSLADHMAEGMKRTRAGQETRMADIPADAGCGRGAFETLHHFEDGAEFSRALTTLTGNFYGATGREWLQWLVTHADTLKARIKQAAAAFVRALVPEAASGQVHRVGMRFALVGAAGELATEAGLTGWPKGEAERAARACFNAWLAARGGIENGEVMSMTRQVRLFLEANGEGRFTWWHRAMDDHNAKTGMRAGFRCLVTDTGERITSNSKHAVHLGDTIEVHDAEKSTSEFYIFPEVFTSEVCKGFDHKAVCKVLKEHGCLVTEEGHYAKSVRLPGIGKTRCYQINSKIFSIDEN
jgi:putative DNA primase/helicase